MVCIRLYFNTLQKTVLQTPCFWAGSAGNRFITIWVLIISEWLFRRPLGNENGNQKGCRIFRLVEHHLKLSNRFIADFKRIVSFIKWSRFKHIVVPEITPDKRWSKNCRCGNLNRTLPSGCQYLAMCLPSFYLGPIHIRQTISSPGNGCEACDHLSRR